MSFPPSFSPGHYRSRSHNELLSQLKFTHNHKKRSYSDIVNDGWLGSNKRSKTVPPNDGLGASFSLHKKSKSLLPYTQSPSTSTNLDITLSVSPIQSLDSSNEKSQEFKNFAKSSIMDKPAPLQSPAPEPTSNLATSSPIKASLPTTKEKLPSISNLPGISLLASIANLHTLTPSPKSDPNAKLGYDLPKFSSVLNSAQLKGDIPVKLKPITPMASLDYLDTNNYYRADNQWKYDLLHKLDKNLENFSSSSTKPVFDSKISPKFEQLHPNIKQINFPYESNYTYLNKTYMNDIENYPQYLELARSLVEFSRSKPNTAARVSHNEPAEKLVDSPLPPLSTFTTHNKSSPRETPAPSSPTTTQQQSILPMKSYIPEYVPMRQEHTHEEHFHHDREASLTPQTSPIILTSSTSQTHKFIPITPPSSTKKINSNTASVPKSPPRNSQRVCISCGSDQSPCWRPSWSVKEGQLCNSCGLRYKKTSARCLNDSCRKIPAKGEWSLMQSKGKIPFEDGIDGYSCLECGWRVEVKKG